MGTCIALDAMGGDRGPMVTVEGAVAAAREFNLSVLLVGNEQEISRALQQHVTNGLGIAIRHAPEAVGMQESPSAALRKKKQSSIRVGLELVKNGEADAFISAGNTGAVMATALITLGPLPGVERPAIAVIIPTLKGQSILLDGGANADCKARHLLQFAIMGDVYARQIMGKPSPTVGLLSIGEEESKGNELTREAFKGLEEEQSINFIGNVEGREVLRGTADIIVCDGFTGNIALKVIESAAEFFTLLLKEELAKGLAGMAGALLARGAFKRFKKLVDYTEYGGAPLLGVRGVCIISHGRSTAKAIKNAFRAAAECVENRVIEHITEGIAVG
ncbi:MAG: phosphate acyltransferase PlsX [candidate division NC10 bacterium]|nr:phosphate acyltransferase PlsX [candidate division NC10 bacterium]MDE2484767.1 phosphate acyltransferase PlsX [candidate division NC10 bacterium]